MEKRFSVTPKVSKKKGVAKKNAATVVCYVLLIALLVFFIFPFVFMLLKSFMENKESYSLPVKFFPSKFTLTAYVSVMDLCKEEAEQWKF